MTSRPVVRPAPALTARHRQKMPSRRTRLLLCLFLNFPFNLSPLPLPARSSSPRASFFSSHDIFELTAGDVSGGIHDRKRRAAAKNALAGSPHFRHGFPPFLRIIRQERRFSRRASAASRRKEPSGVFVVLSGLFRQVPNCYDGGLVPGARFFRAGGRSFRPGFRPVARPFPAKARRP